MIPNPEYKVAYYYLLIPSNYSVRGSGHLNKLTIPTIKVNGSIPKFQIPSMSLMTNCICTRILVLLALISGRYNCCCYGYIIVLLY